MTRLLAAAEALETARLHCLIAADHMAEQLVPRMAAHALAARGDVTVALDAIDEVARIHARHSSTER